MRLVKHAFVSGAVAGALFVPAWLFVTYALTIFCGETAVCQNLIGSLLFFNPYVLYLRLLGWRFADELPAVEAEFHLDNVSVLTVFLVNMIIFAIAGGSLHVLCVHLLKKRKQA